MLHSFSQGKSAEEIRATFHLPDDLTEEEKLEPVRNGTDDPRIRLLNRLYAKKRKVKRERGQGGEGREGCVYVYVGGSGSGKPREVGGWS